MEESLRDRYMRIVASEKLNSGAFINHYSFCVTRYFEKSKYKLHMPFHEYTWKCILHTKIIVIAILEQRQMSVSDDDNEEVSLEDLSQNEDGCR